MSLHLVLHSLAIKKQAARAAIAEFLGMPEETVGCILHQAVGSAHVFEIQGKYALAPLARTILDAQYPRHYATLRANESFIESYEAFELINTELKALITDWQTLTVAGARVPNDHSDRNYDAEIIDRLGDLHERAQPVLQRLTAALPRLAFYERGLKAALKHAEEGAIDWVSGVRIASYHALWFELHEDLLRILGRRRKE